MIVSAVYKNAKISWRKVNPILKVIRGLPAEKAIDILTFSNKKASFCVKKVIKSAIANAENNNGLDIDKLHVFSIYVTPGNCFKRFRARAKGRSNKIIKRNCHIFVKIKEVQ